MQQYFKAGDWVKWAPGQPKEKWLLERLGSGPFLVARVDGEFLQIQKGACEDGGWIYTRFEPDAFLNAVRRRRRHK